jgi:hypothetical protein
MPLKLVNVFYQRQPGNGLFYGSRTPRFDGDPSSRWTGVNHHYWLRGITPSARTLAKSLLYEVRRFVPVSQGCRQGVQWGDLEMRCNYPNFETKGRPSNKSLACDTDSYTFRSCSYSIPERSHSTTQSFQNLSSKVFHQSSCIISCVREWKVPTSETAIEQAATSHQ